MRKQNHYLLLAGVFIVGLFGFKWLDGTSHKARQRQAYALEAPAALQETQPTALTSIQSEASIAAYFKTNNSITLSNVRPIYRTLETETSDYLIGSVAVEGYNENQDVHLYVHRDGWFLAYYMKTDPASKIIDWVAYGATSPTVPTKFEHVLGLAANAANISLPPVAYYDFRYPEASELVLIAESYDGPNNDFFFVELPSDLTYYELSWAKHSGAIYLNNQLLNGDGTHAYGTLTTVQLPPNTPNSIRISCCSNEGGLAILYGAP